MWEVVTPGGFWAEAGSTSNSLIDIKGTYTVLGEVDLSIIAGGTGHLIERTGTITVENNAIIGGDTNTVSDSANSIIGGGDGSSIVKDSEGSAIFAATNSTIVLSTNSAIVGGDDNDMGTSSGDRVHDSVILGGTDHTMPTTLGVPVLRSAIVGGYDGNIEDAADSAILAGDGNEVTHDRSVVIGGSGLASLADDTVYVPNLNIKEQPANEPIAGLGLDADNNVVLTGIAGEEICGELIDCPTGGPVDGDTLLFNGATGFWDLSPAADGGIYGGSGVVPASTTAIITDELIFENGLIEIQVQLSVGRSPANNVVLTVETDSFFQTTAILAEQPDGTTTGDTRTILARNYQDGGIISTTSVGVDGRSVPAAPNVLQTYSGVRGTYSPADDFRILPNTGIGVYAQAADDTDVGSGISQDIMGLFSQVGRSGNDCHGIKVVYGGWGGSQNVVGNMYGLEVDLITDVVGESWQGDVYGIKASIDSGRDFDQTATGLDVSATRTSGITAVASPNWYGINISELGITNVASTGEITTFTALNIAEITDIGTVPIGQKYGIRQLGPLDENEFAGPITMMGEQELRFFDSGDNNYTGFKAPATMVGPVIYELPDDDAGTSGFVLSSDGAGVLSWVLAGSGAVIDAAQGLTLDTATVELGDSVGGGAGSLTSNREVYLSEQYIEWRLSGASLWMMGQQGVVGLGEFTDETSIGSLLHLDGVDFGAVTDFTDTTLLLSGQGVTSLLQPVEAFHARYDDGDPVLTTDVNNVLELTSTDEADNVIGTIRFDGYVTGEWGAGDPGEGGTSTLYSGGDLDSMSKIQGFPRFFQRSSGGYPYQADSPMFDESMTPVNGFYMGEINFQGKIYNITADDVPTHLSGTSIKMAPYWNYLEESAHEWEANEMADINYASLLIGSQDVGDISDDATGIHTAMLDVVGANGTDPSGATTRSPGPFVRFRGMPSGGTDVVMIDSEDYLFKTTTKELLSGVGGGGEIVIGILADITTVSIGLVLDQSTPYTDADTIVIGTGDNPGVIGDDIIIIGTNGPGSPDPFDISGSIIIGTMGPGKDYHGQRGMVLGPGVNVSTAVQTEDDSVYIGVTDAFGSSNIMIQAKATIANEVAMAINPGTGEGVAPGTMEILDDVNLKVHGTSGWDAFQVVNEINEALLTVNIDSNSVTFGEGVTSYEFPEADGAAGEVLSTSGANAVSFTDVNTLVKENAFETLIASNSMQLSATLPASGTDEAVIGDETTGAGWNGNDWNLTHDFTAPDDLNPENINCGVLLPHDMSVGDIITITCNLYGPNLFNGNMLSLFCYSYDCEAATPEELREVENGEEFVELGGNLTCFTRLFTLTDALSKGQGIVIGFGNYNNGTGGGTADDLRITYTMIATTTI
jgi:hypothetical protein